MERVTGGIAWAFASCALLALMLVPLAGHRGIQVATSMVILTSIAACFVAVKFHRINVLYALALVTAAAYLVLSALFDELDITTDVRWQSGLSNMLTNIAIALALITAVRARRGPFTTREMLDGASVAFGAVAVSWLLVANPLQERSDVALLPALLNAGVIPFSVILFGLTAALFASGVQEKPPMWFVAAGILLNLMAEITRSLIKTGAIDPIASHLVNGCIISAIMFASAAIMHPSVVDLVTLRPQLFRRPAGRVSVRVILVVITLLTPITLIAATSATSMLDTVIRVVIALILIGMTAGRMLHEAASSQRANQEILDRLHRDELTGLPNRSQLIIEINEVLEATWRSDRRPTLMQLNLDRFKNINDTLGHALANQVLIKVAERLCSAADTFGATVARTGGDDFTLLDPHATSSSQALVHAEAVQRALNEPIHVYEHTVFVTASIGLATTPKTRTIDADEFLRRADIAANRAKSSGQDCIAVFDDSMQANLTTRMDVEHALHGAIDRHEMTLYYQPIVETSSGETNGLEALIRWKRGDRIVPPAEFVPIAEESGVITTLGTWVMLEALTDLGRWISDGTVPPTTTMSVNVSPRQLADPDFPDIVAEALNRSGISPSLLWIEVTESMMLAEPDLARRTLRRVRAMGVRLALDDFGTGYSSLSILQSFPIQRIKIDRAFVRGVAEPGHDQSLVRTIVAMGDSMGLDVVAEGVEEIEQLQALRDMGCAKAQGFLISHPVPTEAMRSTIRALADLQSLSMFDSYAEQTI